MPRLADDFRPAFGLSNGHAQTLFARFTRTAPAVPVERQRLETPDGDFIDVDVLTGQPGSPVVLVVHGLEGSSQAGYVRQVLAGCHRRGWGALALNLRSCSGTPNRQAASYSSGDFRDARWLLGRTPGPAFAVGFSLGGSVVLNLLAQARPATLVAAAAICAPYDLAACARYLDSPGPMASIYRRYFLVGMKQKALEKARRFPQLLDVGAIEAARGIRDFDHAVTARLFGFASAEDYYARCSAGPQLAGIEAPVLLLSAEDDALAPPALLPASVHGQPNVDLLVTRHGGHVGHVGGSLARPRFWAEERALSWLERFAG